MTPADQLYKKIEVLAKGTKKDFQSKGIIIPIKEDDGSISFNNYSVVRDKEGFYTVNVGTTPVVEKINLPQTAILLANNLALGRGIDYRLAEHDTQYGYGYFEEQQCKRLSSIMVEKQDWVRFDAVLAKQTKAHQKAEYAKRAIISSFEKFRRLR